MASRPECGECHDSESWRVRRRLIQPAALLRGFGNFRYPNEVGLGAYDIHSPRVRDTAELLRLLKKAAEVIRGTAVGQPGLRVETWGWVETEAALGRMGEAKRELRRSCRKLPEQLQGGTR